MECALNPESLDIIDVVEGVMGGMFTMLPGRIQSFDTSTQLCSVQPTVRYLGQDDAYIEYPTIDDCPVVFPGGGGFIMTFPLQQGDEVVCLFAKHSIDNVVDQGGIQHTDDDRRFDLSDCIVIPRWHSGPSTVGSFDSYGMQLRQVAGTGYVRLDVAGNVEINGATDNAVNFLPLNTSWVQMIAAVNALIALYNTHEASLPAVAHTGSPVAPAAPLTVSIIGAKNTKVKL